MKISKDKLIKILELTDESKLDKMIALLTSSQYVQKEIEKEVSQNIQFDPEISPTSLKYKAKPAKKGQKSRPDAIRELFANTKRKLSIAEISESTGMSKKQAGDICWRLWKNDELQSEEKGVYFK